MQIRALSNCITLIMLRLTDPWSLEHHFILKRTGMSQNQQINRSKNCICIIQL